MEQMKLLRIQKYHKINMEEQKQKDVNDWVEKLKEDGQDDFLSRLTFN